MTTDYRYAHPGAETGWAFEGQTETRFTWAYDDGRDSLLALYAKGKSGQWDADTRIDWSRDLDPENPMLLDDATIPIHGGEVWRKLSEGERRAVRHHHQAYTTSQFLHGEQGALIATARIVESVPGIDAKFYAATQVMDEARHVELFGRLLREKLEVAYPIAAGLKSVLESGLADRRWDMTYLTMQVLIEGMALAAFQQLRDGSRHPLVASINAYVMQDEARHVAFGRLALQGVYADMSEAEREERRAFLVEGCRQLLRRYDEVEVWERLGLPVDACVAATLTSPSMARFRAQLFSRLVPIIQSIGLWGPTIERGFAQLGARPMAIATPALDDDDRIAREFDSGARQRMTAIMEQLARGRADRAA